ncbi:MAG: flavodoxin-dependent (E)-4-hydroxy-3-methylbut-2-enyl-diphosphate synthase [Deltaproteobacteria bacterium]|nr:flavodoxin-dependent (E)-4-hydroxy-3-methylbut-2-enyl-diphosphate synthase [Deltaproteobacteria bacterium]
MIQRRESKVVRIGKVAIGGHEPIRVQSMANTDTRNIEATLEQIEGLAYGGCEIVRLAVPDMAAAKALGQIRVKTGVSLVADIHFDSRLAVAAVEAGIDGLRINPGNIGGPTKIRRVVDAAKAGNVPIRIGVNGGSLEKDVLSRYGGPTPEAMVESAMGHIRILENLNFDLIKVSLKSSSVTNTVEAYRLLAERVDYPFHIGITEAGTPARGAVKSGVGLGILLYLGLGDTLRVSLTGSPAAELPVAWGILRSLGLRHRGPEIISCPTCGRTEIDLQGLAEAVEDRLMSVQDIFTVAVMGCVVNGPGEAREADIGIAGGRDKGIIFRKGRVVQTVLGHDRLLPAFLEELEEFIRERHVIINHNEQAGS